MNWLELFITITNDNPVSGTEFIMFLITGIMFAGLAGLFIFLYFKYKSSAEALKARTANRSPWSFVGFWGNNRQNIIAFLAGLFIILSITFLFFTIGISPPPQ